MKRAILAALTAAVSCAWFAEVGAAAPTDIRAIPVVDEIGYAYGEFSDLEPLLPFAGIDDANVRSYAISLYHSDLDLLLQAQTQVRQGQWQQARASVTKAGADFAQLGNLIPFYRSDIFLRARLVAEYGNGQGDLRRAYLVLQGQPQQNFIVRGVFYTVYESRADSSMQQFAVGLCLQNGHGGAGTIEMPLCRRPQTDTLDCSGVYQCER